MANSVLDKNGLTYLWNKIVSKFMPKSGGTFTGDVTGRHFIGTWLKTTGTTDLNAKASRVAVLDSTGWIYYRTPTELAGDMGVSGGGDGFENSKTTFSTNSAGNKVITQTFSDRTLVSTISTLSNGNKQIVEKLTKSGTTKTKTTIINKSTGEITETVS